jgi:hypothetical protein
MKKRTTKKEAAVEVLGSLPDDAARVRQCLKDLGRPQAWLAKEAGLSLIMVNSFLNGKKNLSPAASDRVMAIINAGFSEKRAADSPRLTSEDAQAQQQSESEIPRSQVNMLEVFDGLSDDVKQDYENIADLRKAIDSSSLFHKRDVFFDMMGPPRDPDRYKAWKARQMELHAAADELPIAKAWIRAMEKRRDALQERVSHLEQIQALNEELVALYKGVVDRLKKQLLDSGITPTD